MTTTPTPLDLTDAEALLDTRAGLALANSAFQEGVSSGIRACNESGPGVAFVKPTSPYSSPLLQMIRALDGEA